MSHLEKHDAVIHDLIEPAAIGCDATFHALPFMLHFAAGSGALDKGKQVYWRWRTSNRGTL